MEKPQLVVNGETYEFVPSLSEDEGVSIYYSEESRDFKTVGENRRLVPHTIEPEKLNAFLANRMAQRQQADRVAAYVAMGMVMENLIAKNVTNEVANKIMMKVAAKFAAQPEVPFQMEASFKAALKETIEELIQPDPKVDVLVKALEAKRQEKKFVVNFCGFHLVGKATSLLEVGKLLREYDLKVMVAAADDFAIAKIRDLLNSQQPGSANVVLYDKIYFDDFGPTEDALIFARDGNYDVVLVHITGVIPSPTLINAAVKVSLRSKPDLVLFVAEALVGNETVNQLDGFNRVMAVISDRAKPRIIDGILLTKLETTDKVGSAVSMAYFTGQPIVFVCTGQNSMDLKVLDSQGVVAALMN